MIMQMVPLILLSSTFIDEYGISCNHVLHVDHVLNYQISGDLENNEKIENNISNCL
jgi:hypothetical protein